MAIMAQATSHAPATTRPPKVCTLVPFIIIIITLDAFHNVVNTFTNNYTIEMQHGEGYWIIIIVLNMKIAK